LRGYNKHDGVTGFGDNDEDCCVGAVACSCACSKWTMVQGIEIAEGIEVVDVKEG